jgi:hypothetical protein
MNEFSAVSQRQAATAVPWREALSTMLRHPARWEDDQDRGAQDLRHDGWASLTTLLLTNAGFSRSECGACALSSMDALRALRVHIDWSTGHDLTNRAMPWPTAIMLCHNLKLVSEEPA